MRILVLQLARFGDIYQTWPALNALKRLHPQCELHLLVRERFVNATQGLTGITVHRLPTQDILRPVILGEGETLALATLGEFLSQLGSFDQIINLSFSPASSYLTDYLTGDGTQVRGYTRHSDGTLSIPDDTSAYFYAQVGIGRSNRYHVTEIFASVAGVDLNDADFNGVPSELRERAGIVVHLGASRADKTYAPEQWVKVLKALRATPVVLIGDSQERALSETVASQVNSDNLVNRVGQTRLAELFLIIAGARLLIGADSAPVHIAALTSTPVLNLSSPVVNFWETGPLTPGSLVLFAEALSEIDPQSVADAAHVMLAGESPNFPCAERVERGSPYRLHDLDFADFSWDLTQAIYSGLPFPDSTNNEDVLAFQRLFELAELALSQMQGFTQHRTQSAKILEQIDSLLEEIPKLNPRVKPMTQWFQTQRLRIGPGSFAATLEQTRKAFSDLQLVAGVYRRFGDLNAEVARALQMISECLPEIRECHLPQVAFQDLLSTLHELSRHSTKVGSQVTASINSAVEAQDFVQLADYLQWNLTPLLQGMLKPDHFNDILPG